MLSFKNRLRKKKDFEKIFKEGSFLSSKHVSLGFLKNGTDYSRFGFIVSKKAVKKAVERNRIKRVLREFIRVNLGDTKNGFDAVVIAKESIADIPSEEARNSLKKIITKAGILKDK